ncbi:MAG: energy transducer TonB, partial [Proteobacteria bacterium]|nr:energy transducer TonB [Pseudomonadota bacterium]
MTLAWSSDTAIGAGAEPIGIGRWTASLLAVVLVHALGAAALLSWRTPVASIEPPPAAVMIELAPLPAPTPPPPVIQPPEPAVVEEVLPEPVVVPPKPDVVLPPPRPKPKPVPQRIEQPPPPQVEPTPTPPRPPEPVAAAPAPVTAPPVATPSYQGLLLSHLERNKRYPREARLRRQEGVATLRFTVDRDGKLLAFKLERSAGHAILDDEVLAMIQRAAPLPPFAPEMAEPRVEFVVP